MPELPHLQGLPGYHNVDYRDPFFRAVSDEQAVRCVHIKANGAHDVDRIRLAGDGHEGIDGHQ